MKNNLLNDFKTLPYIKYKDYVKAKSFPLFQITGLSETTFLKKIGSKLYINKEVFNLEDYSINDILTLLLDKTSVSVSIYEENSVDFLANSAMFISDFSTKYFREVALTENNIRKDIIQTYTDEYLNEYSLKSVKVFDEFGTILYSEEDGDYIKTNFKTHAKLHLQYYSVDLKIRALEEFALTDISQVYLTQELV